MFMKYAIFGVAANDAEAKDITKIAAMDVIPRILVLLTRFLIKEGSLLNEFSECISPSPKRIGRFVFLLF